MGGVVVGVGAPVVRFHQGQPVSQDRLVYLEDVQYPEFYQNIKSKVE